MDYFIDHANWKDGEAYIKGVGLVHVKRGQHLFGTHALAKFFGVGRQQIRSRLELMKKIEFLTIETTNRYSIATVLNYDKYQLPQPAEQPAEQPKANQQPTTPKEVKELKTPPEDFSEKFSTLRSRYPDQNLIDKAFEAIRSTRKSGKVADSVLLAQLEKWARFSVDQVEAGIRTYLEKDYASEGKDEKYLHGIIRNNKPKPKTYDPPAPSCLNDDQIEELLQ